MSKRNANRINSTIISAFIGAIATIAAALIGLNAGKAIEQNNIQTQIDEALSNVVNVNGDHNTVTINDLATLVNDYISIQEQNSSLVAQNTKYFDDLTAANAELENIKNDTNQEVTDLQSQLDSMPDVQYKSIGLSINGNTIPINSTDSSVIVDNRTYYSDEFINNIIDSNSNITIKDNTMYIGKIIAEKSNLIDQWVVNKGSYIAHNTSVTDSYGNMHINSILFGYYGGTIIYNLNQKYSLLQCSISMHQNSSIDEKDTITIKADDTIVYSTEITKTMAPITNLEIPINNCSLLTIICDSSSGHDSCIISDAIVYN